MEVRRALLDRAGHLEGYAVVALDPLKLSAQLGGQSYEPGEDSLVQLRDGGAVIARSHNPIAAITEHVSVGDPALMAAARGTAGKFRDREGATDRLVGFRAPVAVPIVVTHTLDTQLALADFYGLQRVVLSVMLALIVGALVATRLVLANYLLRERLSEQALLDPLTGLRNRRFFSDVLIKRMVNATRLGESALVLLIDLDGFKQVNDTRGHPVGGRIAAPGGHAPARLRRSHRHRHALRRR